MIDLTVLNRLLVGPIVYDGDIAVGPVVRAT